jgi:NADPH:quinone reductase-like Zn-dependent oxidoreductase
MEVIATAGPANTDFVLGLGASEVIDYHDPDATRRLAGIRFLIDAVGGNNIGAYQGVLAEEARIVAVAGLPSVVRGGLSAAAIRSRRSAEDLAELANCCPKGPWFPPSSRSSPWPGPLMPTFSKVVTCGASW